MRKILYSVIFGLTCITIAGQGCLGLGSSDSGSNAILSISVPPNGNTSFTNYGVYEQALVGMFAGTYGYPGGGYSCYNIIGVASPINGNPIYLNANGTYGDSIGSYSIDNLGASVTVVQDLTNSNGSGPTAIIEIAPNLPQDFLNITFNSNYQYEGAESSSVACGDGASLSAPAINPNLSNLLNTWVGTYSQSGFACTVSNSSGVVQSTFTANIATNSDNTLYIYNSTSGDLVAAPSWSQCLTWNVSAQGDGFSLSGCTSANSDGSAGSFSSTDAAAALYSSFTNMGFSVSGAAIQGFGFATSSAQVDCIISN